MKNNAVEEYWLQHYVNENVRLCSLCGNTGVIDTRGRAMSHAGVDAGRLNDCICPNGQAYRENRATDEVRLAIVEMARPGNVQLINGET